jgi:8-oxo-dGTP pyrophosphatase MutT (NUDIX family)
MVLAVAPGSVPSPAATVIVLRDSTAGPEMFLVRRHAGTAFMAGAHVVPGGRVDAADLEAADAGWCDGVEHAHQQLEEMTTREAAGYHVAAARELFEEAGVLLARRDGEDHVVPLDDPVAAERYNAARHAIHESELSLSDFCADEGLVLLVDRIHLVAHWMTPVGERRRFDTRFFVAAAPPAQQPLHDDKDTIASRWVVPARALRLWTAGELQMFPPTVACLEFLAAHADVDTAIGASAAVGVPPLVQPRLVVDDDGRMVGLKRPGDDGYDDIAEPEFVIGNPR